MSMRVTVLTILLMYPPIVSLQIIYATSTSGKVRQSEANPKYKSGGAVAQEPCLEHSVPVTWSDEQRYRLVGSE